MTVTIDQLIDYLIFVRDMSKQGGNLPVKLEADTEDECDISVALSEIENQ